jgi:hypothetical protein
MLRLRGLNIQSQKTIILRSDAAIDEIDGVFKVLLSVIGRHRHEVEAAAGVDAKYMTERELQLELERTGTAPPTEALRSAYQAFFVDPGNKFNVSLFHYLLRRLGDANDDFAALHSLELLETRPEETQYVLDYLSAVDAFGIADQRLLAFLRSEDAVYPYQHYLVVRWRANANQLPSEEVLRYVRLVERSDRTPSYLRSAARMFLGRFGSGTDLERLEERYAAAANDAEQAELICALARQERARRNGFVNRAKHDSILAGLAAARVVAGRDVWDPGV